MYKVFIYNNPIYFFETGNAPEQSDGLKLFRCENTEDKKSILDLLFQSKANEPLFVYGASIKNLLALFFGDHKKIEAAGGVVLNEYGAVLFIDRLGFWDLPKGKVEKNENLTHAAVREVEEECGITNPVIRQKLIETYHTYTAKGKSYFKTTHWYLMDYQGTEKLIPQEEEGIIDVRWVNPHSWREQKERTYNSVLDVMEAFLSVTSS